MFLGRQAELSSLGAFYAKPGFQMVILYGRRRVGKTSLMAQFCRDKRHIFYVAIEQNDKAALRSFSEEALNNLPAAGSYLDEFPSWETAFRYVAEQAGQDRIILVIDEYPYLASGNPSISSILQRSIDTEMSQGSLFLMLCGSSMSFMENQVLGYKSPLYGRRSGQIRVEPFDYLDSSLFVPDYGPEEKVLTYAVAGGIPQYLGYIAGEQSLRQGVIRAFLDRTGPLYEEPSSLLKQELREPALYNSIITAIAAGASRLNDIAARIGEETNKTAKYLKTLVDLRIVKRELPFGEESRRKGLYSVADNMFRFWYRYIPDNVSSIEAGMGEDVFTRRVLPDLPNYAGRVFEDVCRQYILRRNRAHSLPIWVNGAGRWWGSHPLKKRQEEIDVVAASERAAIFGECKWRNEPAGEEVLEGLTERAGLLGKYSERYYMVFSKAGFTPGLRLRAKARGDVGLVELGDLFDL